MAYPDPDVVRIGKGGRIVIPAPLRKALGIGPGDELIAWIEDDQLRLSTWRTEIARIQAIARRYKKSSDRSIVDDFIAEKRAEAARE